MDIVIITTTAQTVQHLLAHLRKDAHATRQCIVNNALVHSMPNVQQTLLFRPPGLDLRSRPKGLCFTVGAIFFLTVSELLPKRHFWYSKF